jgi:hypothetical protein
VLQVLAFVVFLSLMRKNYRSTFWSMETGTEWVQSYYLYGESDDVKANVMKYNLAKWKAIEPLVMVWVWEGWMGWERDKPNWFTNHWKTKVPAGWVPKEGKAEWKESARQESFSGAERKGGVLVGAKIHTSQN